jgi:D-alanyl-D-alanine carboxypeptidase
VLSLQKLLLTKATAVVLAGVLTPVAGLCLAALGAAPAQAEALLLVDVESGRVISEQNATAPWYPASVTKLMTTYVTFKALRDRRITRESLFLVSSRAMAQQPAKMGFKTGTRVTVDNALKMMLVHSANDMAIVLAEGVSASVDKFTAEMNAEAERLGMSQTKYVNPNGLPDEQQVTSARDLAILARALIRDFPEYGDYWHIASIRLGRHVYRNTNKLIDAYAGSDGMKTGFICASGYNLVATASRNGKRMIAVVLGATTNNGRAVKAAQMFERGFGSDGFAALKFTGTVETLEPVSAAPPDMHDEVCPKDHHHPPPGEDSDDAAAAAGAAPGAAANGDKAATFSLGDLPLLSGLRSQQVVLTPGLTAGTAPIDVYTGPAKPPGWVAPPLPPGKGKKPATYAAKPPGGKPAAGAKLPGDKSAPLPKPASAEAAPKPAPKPKPAAAPAAAPAEAQ